MRLFRFTKYIAFTATLGLISSCDDFLDVNQSPNAVLVSPPSNTLVAAEAHLGFIMGSDLHRFTSLIVQQFSGQGGAGIQSAEYDRYNITSTDVNNVWRSGIYANTLADMQKLIEQTEATSPHYSGIAKIMQAFVYASATDAFGDIPFTDALKFEQNVKPRYDKSEEVYKGLITLLNSGIRDLKKTSELKPIFDDLIYEGKLEKWERMANTLKLRLHIHYYPKFAAAATDSIKQDLAKNTLFINSVADNFQLKFGTTANQTNPIDQFEGRRPNQFFPSATIVGLMNGKSDPRRSVYFTAAPGAPAANPYVGAVNGSGATGAPATAFSRMGTYLRGALTGTAFAGDAPIRMLTAAEYHLILAEYYARTKNFTAAKTSLDAGIRASMTMAGVAEAAANTYVAARPALTESNALQQIIEEKFVANYGVAVEPWSDWRRTGFPVLGLAVNTTLTQIPRILPYSDLERVANPENTPARPDITAPTVFWDPGR